MKLVMSIFALCALAVPAFAASVSGTIVFEGKAPRMRALAIEADPHCVEIHKGKEPPNYDFLVLGEGQTMGNVLVQVVSELPQKEYPLPAAPAEFTQKGCVYSPHVFVVRLGQKLRILNPDAINHNVHAKPNVNREFNRSMNQMRLEMSHTFREAESVFQINCDVHPWMTAYCAILDHPFYAVTAPDGKFLLEGLEPGEYEIEAWHERLGAQRAKISVGEDETTTLNFTFKRPSAK